MGFPGVSVVKNPPANAGNIRDTGSIPGSGRSLRRGHATHSSILAWRIPQTEKHGKLQSMASQKVGRTQLKQFSTWHTTLMAESKETPPESQDPEERDRGK